MNDPLFSYAGLSKLLTHQRRDFDLFPLREWKGQDGIIMRHDVDLEIESAVRMADLESKIGIRSSFFFLTTADTYNVRSTSSRSRLRRLHEE